MTNKQALYVLIAAVLLAGFTGRWMLDGPDPAFSNGNLHSTFFDAQWVAFLMTAGATAVLTGNWAKLGVFPKPVLLGVATLIYLVATGIPQSTNSAEWMRGDASLGAWLGGQELRGVANEAEKRLTGVWKADNRIYTIASNALTIEAAGKLDTFSPMVCGAGGHFRFGYATEAVFQSNPKAEPYYPLLARPPVAMYEVACKGSLHTFLLRADGNLVVFRNLHQNNPTVEVLTRVP